MTTTSFKDLENTWDASKRYTAPADISVTFTNGGYRALMWSITADDTPPSLGVEDAHKVRPFKFRSFTLNSGDRLWFAGDGAKAALET